MKQVNLLTEHITNLTRCEKLEVSMKRSGVTYADIARVIGVTRPAVIKMLRGESVPTYRHAQLRKAGIPEQFIPPARDIAPGRKPKAKTPPVESDEPNRLGQAA